MKIQNINEAVKLDQKAYKALKLAKVQVGIEYEYNVDGDKIEKEFGTVVDDNDEEKRDQAIQAEYDELFEKELTEQAEELTDIIDDALAEINQNIENTVSEINGDPYLKRLCDYPRNKHTKFADKVESIINGEYENASGQFIEECGKAITDMVAIANSISALVDYRISDDDNLLIDNTFDEAPASIVERHLNNYWFTSGSLDEVSDNMLYMYENNVEMWEKLQGNPQHTNNFKQIDAFENEKLKYYADIMADFDVEGLDDFFQYIEMILVDLRKLPTISYDDDVREYISGRVENYDHLWEMAADNVDYHGYNDDGGNQSKQDVITQLLSDKNQWNIDFNSSIREVTLDVSVPDGVETISLPEPFDKAMQTMARMHDHIKTVGNTTDNCGQHVNISAKGIKWNAKTFNPTKMMVMLDEKFLNDFFPTRVHVGKALIGNLNMGKLAHLAKVYSKSGHRSMMDIFEEIISTSSKFQSVNFQHMDINKESDRRIEIRSFGGKNYENRTREMEWHIARVAYAMVISFSDIDHNNYLTSVIKIINESIKRATKGTNYSNITTIDSLAKFMKNKESAETLLFLHGFDPTTYNAHKRDYMTLLKKFQ